MIHVHFERPDGRVEEIRKMSPVPTKAGALEYERQVRASLLSGSYGRKDIEPAPTLATFANERWLPKDVAATNRESTIKEKRRDLAFHIIPALGSLPINKITAEHITAFYARMAATLGPKTRKNIGGTLHRILACALEWDALAKLPRFPKVKVPDAKWDFFTREETETLLASVSDPFDRAAILFAFRTGARSGEQIAFRWDDIDWSNRLVVFRRAASRGKVGPTKSGRERKVPLTPQLADALRAMPRRLRSDLVFSAPDGSQLDTWHLSRRLDHYCAKAGLRKIRRHDARHSFASQAVMAGVPLPRVQQWLGHSTIAMTMKYAHLAPATTAELTNALEPAPVPSQHPDSTAASLAS